MDQSERATAAVRSTLGDAVLGAYLYGSTASDEMMPTSDIDVLVVSQRPTTASEREALISALLPMSGRGDSTGRSRSIDLTIVVQADVRPWRYPPPLDFQYGDWWRAEFERGDLMPWRSPSPDLTLLMTMALQANLPIFGPRLDELLDPPPGADVRRAMLDEIPSLIADLEGDERNVILTFARIWMTLGSGVIGSKDAAADWAMSRLPAAQRAVLAHARSIYLGELPETWGELLPSVRPHVDQLIATIQRVASDQNESDHR